MDKYAFQCMSAEAFLTCEKLTVEELEAFFGFTILMGIVKLPDYWSKYDTYHYSPIAERISRNRFLDIRKYLHFADNTTLSLPGLPSYNK